MTYGRQVLALTRHFGKLSISPESSNGFASVGAILPKEETALLPGGLFVFVARFSRPNWDVVPLWNRGQAKEWTEPSGPVRRADGRSGGEATQLPRQGAHRV